jgi:glycolate oxidase FAD binding subunit
VQSIIQDWCQTITDAAAQQQAVRIIGGGSKDFLGQSLAGTPLLTRAYCGVIAYEPSELFITARCGTSLAEIEGTLAEQRQMLAFEPPHFGTDATIGGCVAAGLSGPRRASAGAVRDFVLGTRLIDGRGTPLRFGGQVMKNVAGYDISRLLAGSMGILGLITEVTLKVVPMPVEESTVALDLSQAEALLLMNRWGALPLPISAHCWHDDKLIVRLSGAAAAVRSAQQKIGGRQVDNADEYWLALREQRADFFTPELPSGLSTALTTELATTSPTPSLWRLSLPSTTPELATKRKQLIEWGGALRWVWGDATAAADMRRMAEQAGGHATLFRANDVAKRATSVFHPLAAPLDTIHDKLKQAFDPQRIFNPGRLYATL